MIAVVVHYRQCYGCGVEVDGAVLCPDCRRDLAAGRCLPARMAEAWDLAGRRRRQWRFWFWLAWGVIALAIAGHFIFGG